MTDRRILAIDQGSTNTKALLVDGAGQVLARASSPLATTYPQAGWAEQSAAEIWASVQDVIAKSPRKTPRSTAFPSPTNAKRWWSGMRAPRNRSALRSSGSAAAPPQLARR